jgi:hypothetical protein
VSRPLQRQEQKARHLALRLIPDVRRHRERMHFPARELERHDQPVTGQELRVGETYFSVTYLDEHLTIPVVEPVVFIGRNLSPGDSDSFYFQDAESHRNGVPFPSDCTVCGVEDFGHIFVYERALESLMLCSLRRDGVPGA